jgi:general secretion pathway protein G
MKQLLMNLRRFTFERRRLARRALARGVTLVEILIVLAIVGLIAGGIAVYAVPKFQQAQKDNTRNSLKALHAVAEAWRANHGNECPTVQRLKDEKELAASSDINDAWGSPYKIMCPDDENTVVMSFGPDKKEGSQDDIRFPDTTPQTR